LQKLFYNAKVYVDKGNYQQAVLVEDGNIKAVGSNEEVSLAAHADDQLKKIDCGGHTLVPGFNDSHMHFMMLGETRNQAQIEGVKSIDEMIGICRKFAEEHPEVKRKGIHAIGWNQDLFTDSSRLPDRHDMDKISTEFPVVLERICGHIVSTNTNVLEMLGLPENTHGMKEGDYDLDEEGRPNGIFRGNGCNVAKDLVPDFTMDERLKILKETMDYAVSEGVTSVQSNDVGTTFMPGPESFHLFRKMYEDGAGKLRYRHQVSFNDYDQLEHFFHDGEFVHGDYPEDSWLTLGPLKLFKDGSLGARTALMTNGYVGDRDNHGLEWMSAGDMDRYCKLAKEHNMQVVTHCIGDEAVRQTINSYEKAFVDGKNKLRHALIHCQITDKELIDRIVKDDILIFAQPIFIDYDMTIVEDLVGKELASTSYAFGTLIRKGAHVAYGTDCPVEDCNPFPNIYMAVTRKNKEGKPEGGFYPKECVDVETAVDAYTKESAYGEFMEDKKGRLKPGYYADMVLLDRDIFTCDPEEIKQIKPLMTVTGGKIVFER
jgi:predicted amidohydrolase YtcJ